MLLSMTGYGRAFKQAGEKEFSVEIKSLNSKEKDIRLKYPANYKEKDIEIRNIISEIADRGKIDLLLSVKTNGAEDSMYLDRPLFKKYYKELTSLCEELDIEKQNLMQAIVRMPNVVTANDLSLIHI